MGPHLYLVRAHLVCHHFFRSWVFDFLLSAFGSQLWGLLLCSSPKKVRSLFQFTSTLRKCSAHKTPSIFQNCETHFVCIYTSIHIHIYIYTCTYTYTYTYTHTHTYTYTHNYIYIYNKPNKPIELQTRNRCWTCATTTGACTWGTRWTATRGCATGGCGRRLGFTALIPTLWIWVVLKWLVGCEPMISVI